MHPSSSGRKRIRRPSVGTTDEMFISGFHEGYLQDPVSGIAMKDKLIARVPWTPDSLCSLSDHFCNLSLLLERMAGKGVPLLAPQRVM